MAEGLIEFCLDARGGGGGGGGGGVFLKKGGGGEVVQVILNNWRRRIEGWEPGRMGGGWGKGGKQEK